jgi:hypothetical protein
MTSRPPVASVVVGSHSFEEVIAMTEASLAHREVDPRHHNWYRGGGTAFVLVGVAYLVCLVLTNMIPGSSGSAASYLQETSSKVGVVSLLWIVYMVSDVLLIPALFGLYYFLRRKTSGLLKIGLALVGGYLVFDLAVTEPNWLALASLAHSYGTATPAAQASYVAAAQYGLALVPYLNALSFGISGLGFLLICIVMFRSAFRLSTAVFGMAVMALAMLAAISWFVPAISFVINAVLFGFAVWCVAVGAQLLGAARRVAGVSERSVPSPTSGISGPLVT